MEEVVASDLSQFGALMIYILGSTPNGASIMILLFWCSGSL